MSKSPKATSPREKDTADAPDQEAHVLSISSGTMTFCILGTSPLICNRMAEKAKRTLLLPTGRKTKAERASSLKHVPLDEYRDSVSIIRGGVPTRICMPNPAWKGAMMTAALDLPGMRKSEVGRLTWVQGVYTPIYGVPQLLMSVVRSADISRTPDIRTRAILPRWAASFTVHFVKPLIRPDDVARMVGAAGITCGIGDFRQEKGKGNFGQFRACMPDDPEYLAIMHEATEAQDAALERPDCYDHETEELLGWFEEQVKGRETADA